jgi:hypothetical protein
MGAALAFAHNGCEESGWPPRAAAEEAPYMRQRSRSGQELAARELAGARREAIRTTSIFILYMS